MPETAHVASGKVRELFALDDERLLLVASDRISVFDVVLPTAIPDKGRVLNSISNFWFARTGHLVPNHLSGRDLATVVKDADERALLEGRAVLVQRLRALPIEAVVRGYLTGVTDTAIWTRYAKGQRDFGGIVLPAGMRKNQKLPQPLFDPTTKEAVHDRTLTPEQMIAEGFVTTDLFEAIKSGAQGYLFKNLDSADVFRLLEGVGRGEPALTPGLAKRLLGEFARPASSVRATTESGADTLTEREKEVLELLVQGVTTNRERAERRIRRQPHDRVEQLAERGEVGAGLDSQYQPYGHLCRAATGLLSATRAERDVGAVWFHGTRRISGNRAGAIRHQL